MEGFSNSAVVIGHLNYHLDLRVEGSLNAADPILENRGRPQREGTMETAAHCFELGEEEEETQQLLLLLILPTRSSSSTCAIQMSLEVACNRLLLLLPGA